MTARWTSSQRARTGKVTYMNDRGRMIASLVGGITLHGLLSLGINPY